MNKVKFLLRNINLLNIILLAVAFLLAGYVVLPMLNMNVKYRPATTKQISTVKEEEPAEYKVLSPSDYFIIAEQNLFHPERKIPPEKKEERSPALPKPEFVLYGTLITDDVSFAYLEDKKSPRTTPGRGIRQTALKKGDTMSGYTITEIEVDKIVMVKGEDKMLLHVIDPQRPKTREASAPVTQVAPSRSPYRPAPTRATPPAASTPQIAPKTRKTSAPATKVAPYRPASIPATPPAASTPQSSPIGKSSPSGLAPVDQKVLNILQKR